MRRVRERRFSTDLICGHISSRLRTARVCVGVRYESLGLQVHRHAVVRGLAGGGLAGDGLCGKVDEVTIACEDLGDDLALLV